MFSLKRVMHRVRISDMKAHMHTLQNSREDANRQLKGYQKQLEAIQHDFKPELFHKIDALEAENVKLALDTFNLAEAEARLPQLP